MKSTLSLALIMCLAGSAPPAAAQETTETTAGPLARAIGRNALGLAEAAALLPSSGPRQQSPPPDADIWETVQALVPETRVQVTLTDGSNVVGRVAEVRSDALVIDDVETSRSGIVRAARAYTFSRAEIGAVDVLFVSRAVKTVAASFSQLRALLPIGETVWVTDRGGRETKGQVQQISASSLLLRSTGGSRELAQTDVEEITALRRDSVMNGAIIGAIAGGPAGAFLGAAGCGDRQGANPCQTGALAGIAVCASIGALIGGGIDSSIKGRAVIYRAMNQAPVVMQVVTPRRRPGMTRFEPAPPKRPSHSS